MIDLTPNKSNIDQIKASNIKTRNELIEPKGSYKKTGPTGPINKSIEPHGSRKQKYPKNEKNDLGMIEPKS